MKQFLAVSAIGKDRPGLAHDLVRTISECGTSINDSRMLPLGGEFAMQLLVSGNWHGIARVESELGRLAEAANLSLHMRRTEPRPLREDHIPYSIDVIGPDHPGIVTGLAGFLTARSIEIAEVLTRAYAASQTGAAMFAVQMMINVPAKVPIAHLREELGDEQVRPDSVADVRSMAGALQYGEQRGGRVEVAGGGAVIDGGVIDDACAAGRAWPKPSFVGACAAT